MHAERNRMTSRLVSLALIALFLASMRLPVGAQTSSKPAIELCPTTPGEIAQVRPSVFAFDMTAPTPRTVSGVWAVETDAGWFRVPFGPVKLAPATLHLLDSEGHTLTNNNARSRAQYVDFGRPVKLGMSFIEKATADVSDWVAAGTFQCPVNLFSPGPYEPIRSEMAPYKSVPAGALIIHAVPVPPVLPNTCEKPFSDGRVVTQAQVQYPFHGRMPGGTTMVEITILPDGRAVDPRIFRSSGLDAFDASAVSAAMRSTYAAKIVHCTPVVGNYIFKVTFQ